MLTIRTPRKSFLKWIFVFVVICGYTVSFMKLAFYLKAEPSRQQRVLSLDTVTGEPMTRGRLENIRSWNRNEAKRGVQTAGDPDGGTGGISKHSKHSNYGHCEASNRVHVKTNFTSQLYFQESFVLDRAPVPEWVRGVKEFQMCNTSIKNFDNKFGWTSSVLINPSKRSNVDRLAKGGEDIFKVPQQQESVEKYNLLIGFLEIDCADVTMPNKQANTNHPVLRLLRVWNHSESKSVKHIQTKRFTIAIARGDYANFWDHTWELYGVFLLLMVFHLEPKDVSILILDGHPTCTLDKNWEHIFGPILRVGHLENLTRVNNLILGLEDTHIPLSKWELDHCPYIEEFRTFFLNQYGIHEDVKTLDCGRLTFTFIVRRNQVYHPRNLEGKIERVIYNEFELIQRLMDGFPGVCIQALLMESIPMGAQLEIISETDVLIGMHGAGMMHSTFIPPHGAVVELFPLDWRQTRPHAVMYEKMALWRNLTYESWQNPKKSLQLSERLTLVDADEFYRAVNAAVNKMCS